MVSMVSIQQKCCQKTTKNACFCVIFPFFHFIALHNYPQGIHAGVHGRFFAVYSHLQSPIVSMEISRRRGHRIFSRMESLFAMPPSYIAPCVFKYVSSFAQFTRYVCPTLSFRLNRMSCSGSVRSSSIFSFLSCHPKAHGVVAWQVVWLRSFPQRW